MGAAKKLEILPEEQFIQDALTSGRAFKTEISLKAIGKPDYRFQARVETAPGQHLDLDHVNRLGRILEETKTLHPIVVFKNPKTGKYLIADGFHRFDAYRRGKKAAIPAYQIEGDERDALEYCTMCNRLAMKSRTKEDIEKAIRLLLEDELWWGRSDSWIAGHVGCSSGPVGRSRRRLSETNGRPIPESIERRDGLSRSYRCSVDGAPTIYKEQRSHGRSDVYRTVLHGKAIYLGTDPRAAEQKLGIITSRTQQRKKRLSYESAKAWLGLRGFHSLFANKLHEFPGVRGFHRPGFVVLACNFDASDTLRLAVADLIAAHEYKGDQTARMVVLCYPEDGPEKLIDLYRRKGLEFLTPEELEASLAAS